MITREPDGPAAPFRNVPFFSGVRIFRLRNFPQCCKRRENGLFCFG